jgi:ABC-type multidrug transport system ATPase subunit
MSENIIEINGLTKIFGKHTAVNGLDLHVGTNEIFGLLGPNGAGKSTTIRMMLSLIKPTAGSIHIFGRSLATDRRYILKNIGCIIEKPDFYLYLSARKNLEIFARMSMVRPTAKLLDEMFDMVGLTGRDKDPVKTYSHGMKQRLGLAQALIHDPDLVVLDEPTTGLDPQGIIDLRHLILRLKNDLKKTVILSSHILSEIELIADSMAIINRGRVVVQGKVNTLLSENDLMVFIEPLDMEQIDMLINNSDWKKHVAEKENGQFALRLAKGQLPDLHTFLEDNNARVYSVSYRKRLEDYFLKLTHQPA